MERLFEDRNEFTTPVPTVVTGDIPEWISGKMYRVGPGKWNLDRSFSLQHWFDGAALISAFSIHKGKVEYSARFLESDAYKKMCTVKRPVVTEFGTKCYADPCRSIFSRFFAALVPSDLTDNNFGNIYTLGDELFCSSETCFLWKVDQDNLHAVQKYDLNKVVSVNLASAHPITEEDGTSYNLGASFITGIKYHIIKIPPPQYGSSGLKRASIIYNIPCSWKTLFSYYHSFAMTPNFIIFVEQPLVVNTLRLIASRVKGYSLRECFDWLPKEKTKFMVIDRRTGKTTSLRFVAEPMFFFHVVNSYEDDGHAVVDLIGYDDCSILDKYYMDKLRNADFNSESTGYFRRFVIPIDKNCDTEGNLVTLSYTDASAYRQDNNTIYLTHQSIGLHGLDLPTVNDRLRGRRYRYMYAAGTFHKGECSNAVVKLDIDTGESILWRESEWQYPSEAIFVANPEGKAEDDGALLVVVTDTRPDHSDFLLILNASNMEELARAEVPDDVATHCTIHGTFIKS